MTSHRRLVAIYVAVLAPLAVLDVVLPRHGWGVPIVVAGAWSMSVFLYGVHLHQPKRKLAWYLLACNFAFTNAAAAFQNALGYENLELPTISHILIMVTNVCVLVAFGLFVRARTRVLDRHELLDLAILAISAVVAVKQLVLDPFYESHSPVGMSDGMSMAYLMILLLMLAVLVRLITLPGRRSLALWLLFSSNTMSVVASLAVTLTGRGGGGISMNSSILLGAITLVAAATHPSMRELTEPVTVEAPTFGMLRLVGLGLALVLFPGTAIIVRARGTQLDPLWTLVPALLVTVLVMVRLRLLFTREQAAREEVVRSRGVFRALIEGIRDVILVIDDLGTIHYASESAEAVLGRDAESLEGLPLHSLLTIEDAPRVAALAGIAGTRGTCATTLRLETESGMRSFEVHASDRTHDIDVAGVILVLHDVTEREMLEAQLRHQALHDALTGLPNRLLLADRLEEAIDAGDEVAVLFVDLDDFKAVNDGLGHEIGDCLLQVIAGRLASVVRADDTVARLGGDEFALLLRVGDHAEEVAARVLTSLAAPIELGGHRLTVSASVGVAMALGGTVEELLRKADVAMYEAKVAGKGTFAVFEPAMHEKAGDRLLLHLELQDAVARDELRLLYQPIYDLATGQVRGGEALLRWDHPTRGLLSPDRFISIAEDTGLIVPMGRWILLEACRQAVLWPGDLSIAVNLSARQLDTSALVEDVRFATEQSGLAPSRLVLEITESMLARDMEATTTRLLALKDLGVRIAIDDFGTGYSSLSTLSRFPVDVLKIDRSFIATMLESEDATALVHVLVEMGRALHMDVVAEGIEDAQQLGVLRDQHCQQGQGFYFSRPVDASAFLTVLLDPAVS